jgi:hypothetical protein
MSWSVRESGPADAAHTALLLVADLVIDALARAPRRQQRAGRSARPPRKC